MPTKAVNDRLRESKEFFKAKLEYDAPSVVTNIIDLPAKPYVGEVVNQSIEHTGGPAIYGPCVSGASLNNNANGCWKVISNNNSNFFGDSNFIANGKQSSQIFDNRGKCFLLTIKSKKFFERGC